MKTIAPRAWIVLTLTATVTAASLSLTAQMPASGAPAGQAPNGAAGQGGRGAGGRGGPNANDPINADVDYSKQPPVLPKTPDEELKQFILQPGYRLELVLSDPDIQEPTAIAFDGNGRMFVLEDRGYMHGRGRDRRARSGQPDLAARRHRQRRRLRQAHRLRRPSRLSAFRHAVRTERDPDQGIERAGSLEVHGHQRRRRRRQEGVVRHRLRPASATSSTRKRS